MTAATNAGPGSDATAWHAIAADEVVRRLDSDSQKGLDAAEAKRRLETYGPNRLPESAKQGPLMRFLLQFNNVLVYVLLGAGFIKAMMGLWLDASVILGVVILNGLLGFIQEGRAEKALDSIRNMLSAEARTVRGGETRMIPADELVPGDIVLLESGDRIPADLRLADVKNLRTEEAALTGESVPADKTTDAVAANATVGDRKGMAFSGTLVVSGRATGIVVGTGSDTELGRINQMLAAVSPLETPLLRQIKKFGTPITAIILIVSAVMFAFGNWVRGMPFVELFQAVTGIAVSAIPEGLPALITITLAIGVQRMAKRNAIIRRLPAVETLGSVSRICSDKTGTLTLMEMVVVSAVTADSTYQITGEGYASEGQVLLDGRPAAEDPVMKLLARVSMLCNDSELRQEDGAGRWRAIRPRRRSTRSHPSWGWNGEPSKPRPRVSTPSRSNRSTSSWRRCTPRRAAHRSCSPRERRRSSSITVTGRRPGAESKPRSTAITGCRRRSGWRRTASACWPWRGSRIRASRREASVRPICRRTWSCWV